MPSDELQVCWAAALPQSSDAETLNMFAVRGAGAFFLVFLKVQELPPLLGSGTANVGLWSSRLCLTVCQELET